MANPMKNYSIRLLEAQTKKATRCAKRYQMRGGQSEFIRFLIDKYHE